METKYLVSIITPMYNGAEFVRQTIESVLKQTYTNWEMIVVNDGSSDKGPDIVSAFSKADLRIKLINQVNKGSAAARNNALRNASGRFICFLDSDDILEPHFLEAQLKFIKEVNGSLVYASYNRIDRNGNTALKPFIVPDKVNYYGLLKTCSISCLTAMYDREKINEQYFREELRSMRDDYVFWLTMLKSIDFAYGNKEILASYRIMTTSVTGNKRKIVKPHFNVYYKIEKLGIFKSLYYLANWAFISFFKYR